MTSRYATVFLVLAAFGGTAAASDPATYYYPPSTPGDDSWQTVSAASLGWNQTALDAAIAYAGTQESTALIVLYKGKIVSENYWKGWNLHSSGVIHSAHKTVSGLLFGIMQEQGLAHRDDSVTSHLGGDWAGGQVSSSQEQLIRIEHLQEHTSGLGEQLLLGRLTYVGPPDTFWDYNTLAYRKMNEIIDKVSMETGLYSGYHDYATTNLYDPIGMKDVAADSPATDSSVQSARDMARFGLMMLANGSWAGNDIIYDKSYLDLMRNTSQPFNESYGLLTWLNGKNSYVGSDGQTVSGPIFPAAPTDLYAALGAGDKKIYVVPGLDVVVVRHGDAAPDGGGFSVSGFDNILWEKLCLAMPCGGGAGDTGYLSATANSADSGGDGDGFETNPTNAYADDSAAASNINGAGDRHRYSNYNVAIPVGQTIKGLEVRADWWLGSKFGVNSLAIELSWDGGASWTSQKVDTTETTGEHTVVLGGATDLWGRTWTPEDLGNANFRVRVVSASSSSGRDFFLDWIAVRVHYAPVPAP